MTQAQAAVALENDKELSKDINTSASSIRAALSMKKSKVWANKTLQALVNVLRKESQGLKFESRTKTV